MYAKQGLAGVQAFHEQGPTCALTVHQPSLEAEFRERPPRTLAEASDRIEKLTGIGRSLSQVRQFLRHELGLRWRKTRAIPVPPKKSVEEHVATQKEYLETKLEPRLQEANQGLRTVLFVDASHMVLGTFLCLAQELNIELLFLPSYSPNLNTIERLWKFVKKEALNSKHHTTFDDFRRRIDECLYQLSNTHREALTKLLTLKFQTFENATVLAS